MRDTFKPYFHPNFGLQPDPDNNILFTSEYCSLANGDDQLTKEQVGILLNSINPTISKEIWSRDNHYGFIALSKKFGFYYHKKLYLSNIKYMLQPWDLIFFIWASGGVLGALATFLLPIASLAMIMSVLITSYKSINGVSIMAVDGQLLTRLSINTFNLPITTKICNYIARKKYGGYLSFFTIYFNDPDHPIRILAKENRV